MEKKLKVILGELCIYYLNYKYRTKEIKLLQGIKGVIALKIEEVFL